MSKTNWFQKELRYTGIGVAFILILFLIWDGTNGLGGSEIFTGIALLLVIGAMVYLKNMQDVFTEDINRRVKNEFTPETQPQVFETYRHLKIKELEGLFPKILDDAHGDVERVKKLASIAESVGWKSFIENKW